MPNIFCFRDGHFSGAEADRSPDQPELLDLLQLVPVRGHRGHPVRPPGSLQRQDLLGYQGKKLTALMRLHQLVGGSTGPGCSLLRFYWRENISNQPKQPSFYLC